MAALLFCLVPAAGCGTRRERGAETSGLPDSPTAFARAYAAAVRAGDSAAIKRLIHPTAMQCLSGKNAEFLDTVLASDLKRRGAAAGKYRLTVQPADGHLALLPEDLFKYPVEPTQRVQMDFDRENGSGLTIVRELAPSGDAWLMTYPCPTPAGLRAFRRQRADVAAQEARARKLVAGLPDTLRDALRDLLGRGRKAEAIRRYSDATGSDVTTAAGVVGVLQDSAR